MLKLAIFIARIPVTRAAIIPDPRAGTSPFQESQKARLQQLLQQQGELKGRMAAAEEQWLALSLQLEQSGTE